MERVIFKKQCIKENCNKMSEYKFKNDKYPIYCFCHKKKDMIHYLNYCSHNLNSKDICLNKCMIDTNSFYSYCPEHIKCIYKDCNNFKFKHLKLCFEHSRCLYKNCNNDIYHNKKICISHYVKKINRIYNDVLKYSLERDINTLFEYYKIFNIKFKKEKNKIIKDMFYDLINYIDSRINNLLNKQSNKRKR